VPLLSDLLKEDTVGIFPALQSPDFIGARHKVLRELNQAIIRPDRPSANYTVVSRAAQRMAVHRPQQNRLVFFGGQNDTFAERWKPGSLLPL